MWCYEIILFVVISILTTELNAREIATLNAVVHRLSQVSESKRECTTGECIDDYRSFESMADSRLPLQSPDTYNDKNRHSPPLILINKADGMKILTARGDAQPEIEQHQDVTGSGYYKQISLDNSLVKKETSMNNLNPTGCIHCHPEMSKIELKPKELLVSKYLRNSYVYQIKRVKDKEGNVIYQWRDENNCLQSVSDRDYGMFFKAFIEWLLFGPLLPAGGGWHCWQYVKKTHKYILKIPRSPKIKNDQKGFSEYSSTNAANNGKLEREVLYQKSSLGWRGEGLQPTYVVHTNSMAGMQAVSEVQKLDGQVENTLNRLLIQCPLFKSEEGPILERIIRSDNEGACGSLSGRDNQGCIIDDKTPAGINQGNTVSEIQQSRDQISHEENKHNVELENAASHMKRDVDNLKQALNKCVLQALADYNDGHQKGGVVYGSVGVSLIRENTGSQVFKDIDIIFDDEGSAEIFMNELTQPLNKVVYSEPYTEYGISVSEKISGKGNDDHEKSPRKVRRTVFFNGEELFSIEAVVKTSWMNTLVLEKSQYVTSRSIESEGASNNIVSVFSISGFALLDYLTLEVMCDELHRHKDQQYTDIDAIKTIIYTIETICHMEKRFAFYELNNATISTKKLKNKYNEVLELLHESKKVIRKKISELAFDTSYQYPYTLQTDKKIQNSSSQSGDVNNCSYALELEGLLAKNFYVRDINKSDICFYQAVAEMLNSNKDAKREFIFAYERLKLNGCSATKEIHKDMVKQFVFTWISTATKAVPAYSQQFCQLVMNGRSAGLEDLVNGGYLNNLRANELHFDFDSYNNLLYLIILAIRVPVVVISLDEVSNKINNSVYSVRSAEFFLSELMSKLKEVAPELFRQVNSPEVDDKMTLNVVHYIRKDSDSYHCAHPKKHWIRYLANLEKLKYILDVKKPILIEDPANSTVLAEVTPEQAVLPSLTSAPAPACDERASLNADNGKGLESLQKEGKLKNKNKNKKKKKKKKKKKNGCKNELDEGFTLSDQGNILLKMDQKNRESYISGVNKIEKEALRKEILKKIIDQLEVIDVPENNALVDSVHISLSKCNDVCRQSLLLLNQLDDLTAPIILGLLKMDKFDEKNRDFENEMSIIADFRVAAYRGNPQGSTLLFKFAEMSGRPQAFSASFQSSQYLDDAIKNDECEAVKLTFSLNPEIKAINQKDPSIPIIIRRLIIKKNREGSLSPEDWKSIDSLYNRDVELESKFNIDLLDEVYDKISTKGDGEESGVKKSLSRHYLPDFLRADNEKLKAKNAMANLALRGLIYLQTGDINQAVKSLIKSSIASLLLNDEPIASLSTAIGLSSLYQVSKLVKSHSKSLTNSAQEFASMKSRFKLSSPLHALYWVMGAKDDAIKTTPTLVLLLNYLALEEAMSGPRVVTLEKIQEEIVQQKRYFKSDIDTLAYSIEVSDVDDESQEIIESRIPIRNYLNYSVEALNNKIKLKNNTGKAENNRKISLGNSDNRKYLKEDFNEFSDEINAVNDRKKIFIRSRLSNSGDAGPLIDEGTQILEEYVRLLRDRCNELQKYGKFWSLKDSGIFQKNRSILTVNMLNVFANLYAITSNRLLDARVAISVLNFQCYGTGLECYKVSKIDAREEAEIKFQKMIALVNPRYYKDKSYDVLGTLFLSLNLDVDSVYKHINETNKDSVIRLLEEYIESSLHFEILKDILLFVINMDSMDTSFFDVLKKVTMHIGWMISQSASIDERPAMIEEVSNIVGRITSSKKEEAIKYWKDISDTLVDEVEEDKKYQEESAHKAYELLMKEEQERIDLENEEREKIRRNLDEKHDLQRMKNSNNDEDEDEDEDEDDDASESVCQIEQPVINDDVMYANFYELFRKRSYITLLSQIKDIEYKRRDDLLLIARLKILKTEVHLVEFKDHHSELKNLDVRLIRYQEYKDAYSRAKEAYEKMSDEDRMRKSVFPRIERDKLDRAVKDIELLTKNIHLQDHPLRKALEDQRQAIDKLNNFMMSGEIAIRKLKPIKGELSFMVFQHKYLKKLMTDLMKACEYLESALCDQKYIAKHIMNLKRGLQSDTTSIINAAIAESGSASRGGSQGARTMTTAMGSKHPKNTSKPPASQASCSDVPALNFWDGLGEPTKKSKRYRAPEVIQPANLKKTPHSSSKSGKGESVSMEKSSKNNAIQHKTSNTDSLKSLKSLKNRIENIQNHMPDASGFKSLIDFGLF